MDYVVDEACLRTRGEGHRIDIKGTMMVVVVVEKS